MGTEILDEFYVKDVEPRLSKALEQVEEAFQAGRQKWRESFVDQFATICKKMKSLQEEKDMEIGFLMIHPLRTRLVAHDYRYQIWVYDEEWYVHEGYPVGDLDVSLVFQFYETMWKELEKEYPKYFGKLTEADVEQMMLYLLEEFHIYVTELLRYSLLDAIEQEAYEEIRKADIFHIECGEMLEPSDVIHIEDKKKRVVKLKKWLDEKKDDGSYCLADMSGLVFEKMMLQNLDLRYVDFRECNLEGAHLSICMFNGTKFRRANLRNANLMISIIAGADFTGADLTEANLTKCVAYMGKKFLNMWRKTGYTETSFRNCNLRKAKFVDAVLHGVDFRGADLTEADFTGASVSDCLFDKGASLENLTWEQKSGNHFI